MASVYVWKKKSESAPAPPPQARPAEYAPSAHGVPVGSLTEEPRSAAQAIDPFGALRAIAYCLPASTFAGAEKETATSVNVAVVVVVGETLVDASGVATTGWPFPSTGAIATEICVFVSVVDITFRGRTTSVSVPVTPVVNVCANHSVG